MKIKAIWYNSKAKANVNVYILQFVNYKNYNEAIVMDKDGKIISVLIEELTITDPTYVGTGRKMLNG